MCQLGVVSVCEAVIIHRGVDGSQQLNKTESESYMTQTCLTFNFQPSLHASPAS